jgi:hypothetical protein
VENVLENDHSLVTVPSAVRKTLAKLLKVGVCFLFPGKRKATSILKMLRTVVEYGNGMRIRPDEPRVNLGFDATGPIRAIHPAGMSGSVSEPENFGLPQFDVHMEAGLSVTDCEFAPTEEELSGC